MPTINIICHEANDGWIYSNFISQFKAFSRYKILVNETNTSKYDIMHWLPYYTEDKKYGDKPSTAWHSHMESKNPLKSRFISVAKKVDVAISQSKKYKVFLNGKNIKNVIQIVPGVDADKFKLRTNPKTRNKLVLGYVGRQYSSSKRKNPSLLKKIASLKFVELRCTNGKLKSHEIPAFYNDLDFTVSTALVEGGPMSLTESLMTGVPCICFQNVGMADEFDKGVIRVPYNNSEAFIDKLKYIWDNKIHLYWYDENNKIRLRKQVEHLSHKGFVKKHDNIWGKLC